MKTPELQSMSIEELQDQVKELRAEIFNLRFRKAAQQLDNPLKIRSAKRSLARTLTLVREKELGLSTDGEGS